MVLTFPKITKSIPLKNLSTKINEHTRDYDEEILLYCRSCNRSGKAKKILEEMGYVNTRNIGGIEDVNENYLYPPQPCLE